MIASVLVLPDVSSAAAQSSDVYADPVLEDKVGDYTWFKPPADVDSTGYGTNGFHFTLAIGNDDDSQQDNWAYWSFDIASGRYEVQAYIPSQWATAHPQYLMWADENGDGSYSSSEYVTGRWLNQQTVSGWQSLGTYDFDGDVRIEVRDTRSRDDYRDVGAANARLAVDAIRLRPVAQALPPGGIDPFSLRYSVDDRSNGAGRLVWGPVATATSYDIEITLGTQNIAQGTTGEDTHSLDGVGCCAQSFSVNSGWRITAVGYRVRAVNAAGAGPWSPELLQAINYSTPAPGRPTGVDYDRGTARIIWRAVSGATAYDVEWRQPGETTQGRVALCSSSDDTVLGRNCALRITRILHKELTLRVRAKNQGGTQFGQWSSWESDAAETQAPVEAPGSVSGLRYESGRIRWDVAARATAYDIEWRYAGGNSTLQGVTCSSSCSLGITRAPDKELQFRVRAKNGGGTGPWSAWTTEAAEVNVPGAVSGLDYRSGRIVWQAASGASAYDVEWRHRGEQTTAQRVTCSSSCFLAVQAEAGKQLQFRVRGISQGGSGSWTAWHTYTKQTQAPSAPRNVRAVATGERNLRASWSAPSDSGSSAISHYLVQYSRPAIGNGDPWKSDVYTTTSTSHTKYRLRYATTYTVTVTAVNRDGQSSPAATARGTTNAEQAAPPSAPRNVRAVANGERNLRASWSAPSSTGGSAISHYLVQYSRPKIGSSPAWTSDVYTTKGTSHTKYKLRYGTTYTVRVWAVNEAGKKSPAATARGTTNTQQAQAPSAPRNVRATAAGERNLWAIWSAPSSTGGSAISHYLVQYSRPAIGNGEPWDSDVFTTKGTSHIKYKLRYGTTYTVKVWAVNKAGKKSPAATGRGTTNQQQEAAPPSAPRNLRTRPFHTHQLRVEWDAPSNTGGSPIKHYEVQYSRAVWEFINKKWFYENVYESKVFTTESTSSISPSDTRTGTVYRATVVAVNQAGKRSRPAVVYGITGEARYTDTCPLEKKYVPTESGGLFFSKTRATAQVGFKWRDQRDFKNRNLQDIPGQSDPRDFSYEIRKGAESGTIKGFHNLSPTGCAWITGNAQANDDSYISGSALLKDKARARDRAKVHGNALIAGSAEVKDDASVSDWAAVYGKAEVYDQAKVYENARVYGDAKIGGDAVVRGTARIFGNMKFESGIFDGKAEFERAAKQLYDESFDAIVTALTGCRDYVDLYDDAESHAKADAASYLAGTLTYDKEQAETLLIHCKRNKVIESIIANFTGELSITLTAISFALPLLKTVNLGPMMTYIVEGVGGGLDLIQVAGSELLDAEFRKIASQN